MQEHTATDGLGNVFVVGGTGTTNHSLGMQPIMTIPPSPTNSPNPTCPHCGYCPYCQRSAGTQSIPQGPVYPGSFPAWPGPYTTWI